MESLTDYGYSGMDNGTNVHHFLQKIKITTLEAAVNAVHNQRSMAKILMSYFVHMVRKKSYTKQSIRTAKTRHQPVMPKVVTYVGKIECKKYSKAVWNSMFSEQQMQVRKLHEQQGIKPTAKQTSAEARIAALKVQLGINSQTKESDAKKKGGETFEEPVGGRNIGYPAVTRQALDGKCKETG